MGHRSGLLLIVLVVAGSLALPVQADGPPQTRQLRVNDVEISYVEQGTGTPVVFVHGAFSDLRYWEPQRQPVAARYRFIAYTYRYHGTARWPDDGQQYSAAMHASDLAAFIRGLNAGPVHLVTLSYGGILGSLVASEHPPLVRSLTLAEPAIGALLTGSQEAKPLLDDRGKAFTAIVAAVKAGEAADHVTHSRGHALFLKRAEYVRHPLPMRVGENMDRRRTLDHGGRYGRVLCCRSRRY